MSVQKHDLNSVCINKTHFPFFFLTLLQTVTIAPPLAQKKSISTFTIVSIVLILVLVIAVIVGIVLYRYCRERNETFQFAVDGNSLRPSLRSRVKNAMSKKEPSSLYYNHSRDEVNFDDSKPFVDHDEL